MVSAVMVEVAIVVAVRVGLIEAEAAVFWALLVTNTPVPSPPFSFSSFSFSFSFSSFEVEVELVKGRTGEVLPLRPLSPERERRPGLLTPPLPLLLPRALEVAVTGRVVWVHAP